MPIGEAAVRALLQVVFDKLVFSPGVDLFLKLRGGDDLGTVTRRWNKQLKLIEPVLGDAEQKQWYNDAGKTWMEELQDLAYDIEDFLDDFNNDQLNAENSDQLNAENNNQRGIKNMVQSIYASASRASEGLLSPVNQKIQSRIDDITERLQDIQTQIQRLGLSASNIKHQQSLQTETLRSQRESTPFISEREVITQLLQQLTLQPETSESWRESTSLLSHYWDREKDEIITQLLKDEQINENFAVVPIVGMGGIGKTTLAQYVYNDELRLKGHFDLKAWVCVSDVFNVKQVTTAIINSATEEDHSFSSVDQAQVKLKKLLNNKKFLIVLDDVWTPNYQDWDKLKAPFGHAAKGSRVIMTTRNKNAARMMIDDQIHTTIIVLHVLSDDECWCLFQQHAKGVSELVEKRVIIERCRGLPLVAKALGCLLKSAGDQTKCQMILNSNIWREASCVLPDLPLPVLRLSYDHLPSNLKRVFAYCSVYPKDYEFHEMKLVSSWMAQGFLPESERMVDVGHTYFFDLVSRSLFEKSPSGRGFIMHDLIHDLAQWAAGDICGVPMQRDRGRTRHLFLSKHCIDETLGNQLLAPQLRTFISPKECYNAKILDYIQKLKYVRTLDLALEEIEELPDLFGGLIHLRCLTLSIRKIKVLPKSISKLCNLQTLDLNGCKNLEEIPSWLGDPSFKNMVHIRLSECMRCEYLPPLGQLPKLEILCIEDMRGIKQVDLEFYGSCPTPFPALKSLEFRNMGSWEKWVHSPGDKNRAFSCLEKLAIYNCKSLQGNIPPHLPSLKELTIDACEEMSVSLPSLLSPKGLIRKGYKEFSIKYYT